MSAKKATNYALVLQSSAMSSGQSTPLPFVLSYRYSSGWQVEATIDDGTPFPGLKPSWPMRQLQARSDRPVRSRFGFLPVPPELYGPWLPSIPPPSCALLPGLRGGRFSRRGQDQQDDVNPYQAAVMLSPFAALRGWQAIYQDSGPSAAFWKITRHRRAQQAKPSARAASSPRVWGDGWRQGFSSAAGWT